MTFTLPPIKDEALNKFCVKHNLYEAVASAYHYVQKCFPKTQKISIDFYPPYHDDEPEEAAIDFVIETGMTYDEVLDARERFIKATNDVSGIEYIVTSYKFVKHE